MDGAMAMDGVTATAMKGLAMDGLVMDCTMAWQCTVQW